MANTVSFNITGTVDTVKAMNSYRRMIANGCYKVISIYNDYPISTWTGSKRKQLHEKLFGTDTKESLEQTVAANEQVTSNMNSGGVRYQDKANTGSQLGNAA